MGACMLLFVCAPTVWNRFQLSASGVVVDSVTRFEPRRSVYYTLHGSDGSTQTLVSGPTDASLPRNLQKGTVVEKRKWQMGYSLGHVYRLGFPAGFYAGGMLSAVVLFVVGLRLWIKSPLRLAK